MIPDYVNGTFEVLGSLAIWFNVRALHRHKQVRGVSPVAVTFFLGTLESILLSPGAVDQFCWGVGGGGSELGLGWADDLL